MKNLKMIKDLEEKMNDIYRRTGNTPDDGYNNIKLDVIDCELDDFIDYLYEENDKFAKSGSEKCWSFELEGKIIYVSI